MTPAALEALANATIGLVVSWLLTVLVLGYTPVQSAGVTAIEAPVQTPFCLI